MRRAAHCLPRVAAAAILALAVPASAATDTDQLTVTATVQSGCALDGGTLNFGQYVSGQQTDLDVTGTIGYVSCSGSLTIELDGGGNGSTTNRQMRSGENRLNYQIFRNPTRTANWGGGNSAHGVTLIGTQSGSVQVYGRIPRNQTVPAGTYTDIVNITLNF